MRDARRSRLPYRLAAAFGVIHFLICLVCGAVVLYLSQVPVAQWQMTWLYLEPIDWPVSQLIWWEGWPRPDIEWLPYPLQDPFWFFIPFFVFGVLGSMWYALLGGMLGIAIDFSRILVGRLRALSQVR
jgi:hypothetical protein